jgi:serine/threonine protein kinase
VIIGHDANGSRPVLLDFGLVKLLGDDGPGLTSSRSMLGTPAAMAPEQMKGQNVTAQTDVYALGLLAFHMLTGTPAFGGAPGVVQSYLQIHGPRPRPSTKVDIDPAIDEPIVKALSPDPAQRYATARELIAALRAVIAPSPDRGEQDVIALYVEGGPVELARASGIATSSGLTIAMTAPDSLLAVGASVDVGALRTRLAEVSTTARVAIGQSRATLCGGVVDGPALDVEGWAPYPLEGGLWITPALL